MFENLNWHQLEGQTVLEKLFTNVKGLNEEEARFRLKEFGPNKIAIEKKISKIKLFLNQFNNPIIFVLIAAAIVTFLIKEISDSLVILVVLFINSTIGFIQEMKADDAMKALQKMAALKARLRRSGREVITDSENVVMGDIILLESGTKIPADLRILEANNLSIDESMLTGESLHVQKDPAVIQGDNVALADKINMVYSGTIVTRGRGIGVVVATAKNTEFGKIAQMISEQEDSLSPLQLKIEKFGKLLTLSILIMIVIIFILGEVLRGIPIEEMALTAVGLAVSAIPEGLPIAVTVTLSIGLYKMARRNAIIRKLPAVETLGSTTVICSDKTGTLTKNEMTVHEIYAGNNFYHVSGTGYAPEGQFQISGEKINPADYPDLLETLFIGYVCNESKLETVGTKYKVVGDPTEGALLAAGMKAGLHKSDRLKKTKLVSVIPFESDNQYMATLVESKGKYFIFIKGSIEKIIALSSTQLIDGKQEEINTEILHKSFDEMTGKGLRVLGHAYKEIDALPKHFSEKYITDGFVFAGLEGMMDPPREEVRIAINDCHIAGIRVIMITGDHQKTAEVIARKLGIIGEQKARVITGKELDSMSDDDLFAVVNDINVFARVTPMHKLRIVKQLRKHGHIAAMTGDGVNDAPALKSSDIGIAMGSGTDVAKEASSMIVADDNFASIFSAVEYGRIIFNNLQNILLFVLTTSMAGIITIFTSIIIGIPLPFVPVQILFINLVTDGTSTVPLAFEEGERDVIYQKPRNPKSGIITKRMGVRMTITSVLMSIAVLVLFVVVMNRMGGAGNPAAVTYARTMAFCTFGLLQIFNAHNCRSYSRSLFSIGIFRNKYLLMIHSISITLQIILIETVVGHDAFKTTSLSLMDWGIIVGLNVALILFVEIVKYFERKTKQQENGVVIN
jgi:potassium/sodium efflux P-type ATPase